MSIFARALLALVVVAVLAGVYGTLVIRRGFRATDEPTVAERIIARSLRNLSIPLSARHEPNPLAVTAGVLDDARSRFHNQCATCHGEGGSGRQGMGANFYPKPPDLSLQATQALTDGELHYIIRNGVRLTGMPAWNDTLGASDTTVWGLVHYIRSLAGLTPGEERRQTETAASATYVGSQACAECHRTTYDSWKKTPMANVVRDPREHPDAIVPDLTKNPIAKFTKDDVALVYGSIWKQRYFTKIGDDYYPQPAQWDFAAKMWRPYFVAPNTDWWVSFYPPDNMKRPTGPTCDGCHSVNYDIRTKKVTEWNVGCERCHGPGSEHVARKTRDTIINPARLDDIRANDTCIQCHSQGRPHQAPIEGQYYDWPVGYHVGLNLRDFWALEEHSLGQATFTHFPDGTAHKNRMQGNDYVQSLMYRRGVTCSSCHDVHGTEHYAQLRAPVERLCLECHKPMGVNGPREATLAAHSHHKDDSAGSQCVACHMPKIETTIADTKVRAHTFAFITPSMTDRYKMPNPCTSCHTDKTTAWATEAMRGWSGQSPWRTE